MGCLVTKLLRYYTIINRKNQDSYSDRFLRGVHISSRVQETVLDLSVEKQSILEKADRISIYDRLVLERVPRLASVDI